MQTAGPNEIWLRTGTARLTIRFDEGAKRVEEPPMTVQFLLVLFLETKNDLNWTRPLGNLTRIGNNDRSGISRKAFWFRWKKAATTRNTLENMGCHIFSRDRILGNALLVASHEIQYM